jgi:hypothetical protein
MHKYHKSSVLSSDHSPKGSLSLRSLLTETDLRIFLHSHHALEGGFCWLAQDSSRAGCILVEPSHAISSIAVPSPVTMSDKYIALRYNRHLLKKMKCSSLCT